MENPSLYSTQNLFLTAIATYLEKAGDTSLRQYDISCGDDKLTLDLRVEGVTTVIVEANDRKDMYTGLIHTLSKTKVVGDIRLLFNDDDEIVVKDSEGDLDKRTEFLDWINFDSVCDLDMVEFVDGLFIEELMSAVYRHTSSLYRNGRAYGNINQDSGYGYTLSTTARGVMTDVVLVVQLPKHTTITYDDLVSQLSTVVDSTLTNLSVSIAKQERA